MRRPSLVALLVVPLASALTVCRYTVRDIGFVDLAGPLYRLERTSPRELDESERALATRTRRDSNVVLERVAGDRGAWSISGPAERRLAFADDLSAAEAVRAALESPVRETLLSGALETFAFVLLVEGVDAEANERARAEIAAAREGLAALEGQLPRPIDWPLRDLVVERSARGTERVLLWSLGLDGASGPAACVLYGRGKLAGPVLVGDRLERARLLAQLVLVGESCECDAPRDWVGEPSIPLRWTDVERRAAAGALGFDPESPMVKSEVVRILARGPGGESGEREAEGIDALVFGYRETALEPDVPAPVRGFGGADSTNAAPAPRLTVHGATDDDWGFEDAPTGDAEPTRSAAPTEEEVGPGSGLGLWTGVAILAVLSCVGAALVLRRRKAWP